MTEKDSAAAGDRANAAASPDDATSSQVGPLAGVRVLDLTAVLLGPYATQILGDLGAEVIKVESPDGDITRDTTPSRHPGMGAIFLNNNRNKRSIVLDLKKPEARQALLRLAQSADVFIHAMRPQAIARLGLGYAELAKANPRIVYCGAYGYGAKGPYASRPAYDDLIQGVSGLAALQGRAHGRPEYVATVLGDKTASLTVAYAVIAALFHRERTGEGQAIEVPMFETLVSFVLAEHLDARTFRPAQGDPGYARVLAADRRPYQTADGYVCAMPYTDRHWRRFFELIGRPEMAEDPRFATMRARQDHLDTLYALISDMMRTRSTAEWVARLDEAEIPVAPVNEMGDLFDDPHLAAVGLFREVEHPTEGAMTAVAPPATFSRTDASIRRLAPRHGEHGWEILKESGFDEAEIAALVACGALLKADD